VNRSQSHAGVANREEKAGAVVVAWASAVAASSHFRRTGPYIRCHTHPSSNDRTPPNPTPRIRPDNPRADDSATCPTTASRSHRPSEALVARNSGRESVAFLLSQAIHSKVSEWLCECPRGFVLER